MLSNKLTETQGKALVFIRGVSESKGTTPTLRELCDYMGYKSIGSAQDVVAALRRKGYLKATDTRKARSLMVTREGKSYGRPEEDLMHDTNTLAVPCLGKVPAGHPLEAIEERVGVLRVSYDLLGTDRRAKGKTLYALQADGESMVGAGILDGDWLVVRAQLEAEKDDVVVAMIGEEATVKRLKKDRKGWYLKPENPLFENTYAKDRPFKILGKVVALQRSMH